MDAQKRNKEQEVTPWLSKSISAPNTFLFLFPDVLIEKPSTPSIFSSILHSPNYTTFFQNTWHHPDKPNHSHHKQKASLQCRRWSTSSPTPFHTYNRRNRLLFIVPLVHPWGCCCIESWVTFVESNIIM